MKKQFDYIIVGAGSAGCVLANRLTESSKHQVLLLETGGSDKSIFIQMPTALSYPMNTEKFCWQFHSQPEPFLDNREMHCPRGKVLGGSSSINGMVYVRGHAKDYDQWESQGVEGWSYGDCLPYFKRSECWQGGESEYRGGRGPVATSGGNNMRLNPLYEAFIEAGVEAGYPKTDDYNGEQQEGFGAMHMTVNNGVRASASNAHLKLARKRANLTLLTGVLVQRVLLKDKTAIGIEYKAKGRVEVVMANQEVILSAGSVGSPQILQLSGIGPADVLADAGVECKHKLPGVGENLQDHLEVYFQYECKQPITLNDKLNYFSMALIGARWLLFKSGLGATNHFESCGFIRSRAGIEWPNIQYHFLPAAMRYDGKASMDGHGYQVHVGPNNPSSRGSIKITSAKPEAKPAILFNYLQSEQDRQDWRDCIRLTREILHQPAFDAYRGAEAQPGAAIGSDDEIDAWVRDNVESAYHPSCTCKMGAKEDSMAVIDNKGKVHGLEKLRVVDSSIFPTIPNGNLNAPTLMVAEKLSDEILGKQPLPKSGARVWIAANWQTSQRQTEAKRPLENSL